MCVCDESKRKSPIIGSWKWFPCSVKSAVRDFERADWLTNTELAIDTTLLKPRLTNMKGSVPRQTNEEFFFPSSYSTLFLTSHLLYSSLSTWFKGEEGKKKKEKKRKKAKKMNRKKFIFCFSLILKIRITLLNHFWSFNFSIKSLNSIFDAILFLATSYGLIKQMGSIRRS